MPKPKRPKKADPATTQMTTAEATVATLIAHGFDTVYALPGVHNDHLFDAFHQAGERLRVVHTRHEQGAAYMALGAALATGKPQAYSVVPGPGLLNSGAALLTAYGMNAPVLALIGQIPAATIGKGLGLSARDPRPGRHHRAAGRSFGAHRRAGGSAEKGRTAIQSMHEGRPGPAALECAIDVWGKRGAVGADRRRRCGRARRASTRTQSRRGEASRQRQARADRRRRRRAGCLARSDAALRHAAGAGDGLPARARRARLAATRSA